MKIDNPRNGLYLDKNEIGELIRMAHLNKMKDIVR